VWGRHENTQFINLRHQFFKDAGLNTSSDKRSHFHLSDKEKLAKMVEGAGFKDVIAWYQSEPYNFFALEDFKHLIQTPYNTALLS
jgi:hypothetical protein